MTGSETQTAAPLDARLLKLCRTDVVFALLPPYSEMQSAMDNMVYTLSSALLWGRRDVASMTQRVEDGVLTVSFEVDLEGRRRRFSELMEETGKLAWAADADRWLSLWRHPLQKSDMAVSDWLRRFLDHLRKNQMEVPVIRAGLEEDVDLGLAQWLTERRAALMGNLYLLTRKSGEALGRKLTDQEITAVMLAAFESTDAPAEYVRRIGVLVGFAVENAKNVEHAKFMITDLLPPVNFSREAQK